MINEFLVSGKLNNLSLGLSKSEARNLLGEAEAYSDPNKRVQVWKFNDLQVGFDREVVCLISMYINDGTAILPNNIWPDRLIEIKAREIKAFKQYLLSSKIDYEVDNDLTFDDQVCLRISKSGVGVYFIDNELHSIQVVHYQQKS